MKRFRVLCSSRPRTCASMPHGHCNKYPVGQSMSVPAMRLKWHFVFLYDSFYPSVMGCLFGEATFLSGNQTGQLSEPVVPRVSVGLSCASPVRRPFHVAKSRHEKSHSATANCFTIHATAVNKTSGGGREESQCVWQAGWVCRNAWNAFPSLWNCSTLAV